MFTLKGQSCLNNFINKIDYQFQELLNDGLSLLKRRKKKHTKTLRQLGRLLSSHEASFTHQNVHARNSSADVCLLDCSHVHMLCLQMKPTSLHSIYKTKILSVKTKIYNGNGKAKKSGCLWVQISENRNTMLTEDKKHINTRQKTNFQSEVETKTNGDRFDSNARAKHHQ